MIQKNLDHDIAQYPNELSTYGGNGAVFQNWAQYRLTMAYLSRMTESQTLVMYSGHPLGLFPSNSDAPRLVITNGMVIPNHSKVSDLERMNALGVTQYGQMTAGSYMYIGPQGIVHGTMITILNAARKYLRRDSDSGLQGLRYVSSGLGGMSGAQAKAAVISGVTTIIAEVNKKAAEKRHQQGWVDLLTDRVDEAIDLLVKHSDASEAVSIGYIGNIVELWERLAERNIRVDLGSDQTSLHNPMNGGYIPVGMSLIESNDTMANNNILFQNEVKKSLKRQINAIDILAQNGMAFWDYGNAFLLEAERAGCNLVSQNGGFRYPSYVEDIMGPLCFDYGFGPFRWVCCSGDSKDLIHSDKIAQSVLTEMLEDAPANIRIQINDNLKWISSASEHNLVVGSQSRILYADEQGRRKIASALNSAIKTGEISAPIVLGRDHHDVSGTDSPYRETANIRDGSMFTADMSVHNFVGDSFRGATWVSLHNGGGVGWGEVVNGGFGLLLDGSQKSEINLQSMIDWDVNNGIARRAWARNEGALETISAAMKRDSNLEVTIPFLSDDELITNAMNNASSGTGE